MCDIILCDRCHSDADTDLIIYTNNFDYLCGDCHETDSQIEELDNEIGEILDALEKHPSNFRLGLDLKSEQDKLNDILKEW